MTEDWYYTKAAIRGHKKKEWETKVSRRSKDLKAVALPTRRKVRITKSGEAVPVERLPDESLGAGKEPRRINAEIKSPEPFEEIVEELMKGDKP